MKNKKRIRALLLVISYTLIYSLVQIAVQSVFTFYLRSSGVYSEEKIFNRLINGIYAISVISIMLSFWIYVLIGIAINRPVKNYIYRHKIPPMGIFMFVCTALGSRLAVTAYFHFAQKNEILKNSLQSAEAYTPTSFSGIDIIICLFAIIIIAPMFEEFLFRGLIMGELMRIMRPWSAILFQGILFGIAHMVLFQSIFASIMGVILGILYYYSKSYKANVICHSIFNYSVVISAVELNDSSALIFLLFGTLLTVSSMIYIIKNCR